MNENYALETVKVIVKKKKHGTANHGGAWKVAYADFITAMMALFLVLWIVGASSQIKGAVSLYFSNPDFFKGGAGIMKDASMKPSNSEMLPKPEFFKNDLIKKEMTQLSEEGKKIEDMISSNPDMARFKDKVMVSVNEEGMKIELIENSEGLFFNVGSAEVKPETITLLGLIAAEIKKLSNRIIIEGHTDARPYQNDDYSNWELSSDRANAARKLLEENGVNPNQVLEVRGLADRFLKHRDKPFDYSNRRVNILLVIQKQSEPDKSSR